MIAHVEIPIKLPGLNDWVRELNRSRLAGNSMKQAYQRRLAYYLEVLPELTNPVRITFTWCEANRRRDYDNIAFAKKFILDALVRLGKLPDDNRKHVIGFTDRFALADDYAVILDIEEVTDPAEWEDNRKTKGRKR